MSVTSTLDRLRDRDTTFEASFIYFYYCQLTKVFPLTAEGLAVVSGIATTTTASTSPIDYT
jgi:hypothetical protein